MNLDEYVLGLLAIISGLAISEMIGGLHSLLFYRRRVDWDWLTPVASLFVAYYIIASWWVSWTSFHGLAGSITLGRFLVPVAQLTCLYVAAKAVLAIDIPASEAEIVDLEAHYFATKRYLWLAMAANSLLVLFAHLLFFVAPLSRVPTGGTMGNSVAVPVVIFGLAYYLSLAFIDNRLFHRIAVPVALIVTVMLTFGSVIEA